MSYVLTEDQRSIQDMIRRLAREKVAPRADQIDRTAEYPQDMFDMLKELGLFAIPFPAEFGGTGSLLAACLAIEELNRVCYNTSYLMVLQWVPFEAIRAAGDAAQQARFLPPLSRGDIRSAMGLTEPQSGSDLSGIKTRAEKVPGGYKLTGGKIWCSNAAYADIFLVAAKVVGGQSSSINMFIVERGSQGFTVGRKEEKTGARGIPSCALFLDEVFVPEENRLGPEGPSGFKSVMAVLNRLRPVAAARGVGLAQGAIDHAVDFIRNRRAFGQSVADFQGVRWMIADMVMQTEAARQLTYRAASMIDAGATSEQLAPFASMSKCYAADVAMKVATDAMQLFGAASISAEYTIGRYFRDAKVLQIIEGTNQIQRNIIADSVLGRVKRNA
ncbi:MAG: acyl-CoA dehydrogenase family protein [Gammaproteobacteria bacterium]